jgi:Bacterial Ig-like domain (group 3)
MKGIPALSLRRLKRAAVLTGVSALVLGGALLGTTQAHAAVTPPQLGTGTGLTISPATGSASSPGTVTYNSVACPAGLQGAGALNIIDPTSPAGTTPTTVNADQPAPTNQSVASAFSGTFNAGFSWTQEENLGLNITAGQQFEIAMVCYQNSNFTGNQAFEDSTFVTINANGTYTANQTLTQGPQSVNLALTANPNPATSGQSVTLTATASVSGATGTVQFENNGTNINGPATISGGVATTTFTAPTVTTATTESLTAVYTPSGNFTAGTAGSLSLPVNPAPANSGTIPLAVSVPQSGSFTLTVDTTDVVTLSASGLTATGATTPITVADTRNSYPGWSVSGQDGSWTGTGTAAGGTFTGNQLGWVPTDTALAPAVTLGSAVTAASPGLGTAAPLASVHAGLGNGYGTSTLGANLTLVIPPTAPAGPYTSGLTISAVTSNP